MMIDKNNFSDNLEKYKNEGILPEKYYQILKDFYFIYLSETADPQKVILLFTSFLELVKEQLKSPYEFNPYHKKIREPFDFYLFGINFLKPLVKEESKALGIKNLENISKQLKDNENIILLANHQTESDPQAISILLENSYPDIASKIIYVAGERVINDPLAVPFSKGCDLLCIYSKKYIDNPPELKEEKQFHNKKTMEYMSLLLKEGGKIIYVAPSGGRDRPGKEGIVEVAPFDSQSIEMFYLMAKKSEAVTHFYPLSLLTYSLLPPPDDLQVELGEKRKTKKAKILAFFGEEINMEKYPGNTAKDKLSKRKNRALYIHGLVKKGYDHLRSL
jgi:glycerol-3-phosphate O-acyltransferase